MQATWWTRLAIVFIVVSWGVWTLVPTFMGDSNQELLTSQADDANTFQSNKTAGVSIVTEAEDLAPNDLMVDDPDTELVEGPTNLKNIGDQVVHGQGEISAFGVGGDVDFYTSTADRGGELEITLRWSDWLSHDKVTWSPRDSDYTTDASGVRRVRADRLQLLAKAEEEAEERYLTDRIVFDVQITDGGGGAVLWEGDTKRTFGNFSVQVPVAAAGTVDIRLSGQEKLGTDADYQLMVRLIEEEVELPWWSALLPDNDTRINLGLDLQGGIDFTLGVQVQEAVISAVQRDLKPIKEEALLAGVSLEDVQRKTGEATLLLLPSDGVDVNQIDDFMSDNYNVYKNTGREEFLGKDDWIAYEMTDEQQEYIKTRAVEQAIETLRSRIDETGVKEPSITQKGPEKINVQLPGMDNVEDAMAAIGTAAVLEFMPVHEDAMDLIGDIEVALQTIEREQPEIYENDELLSNAFKQYCEELPPPASPSQPSLKNFTNMRLMWEYGEGQASGTRFNYYVVEDDVILTGDDVNDAHVSWNQFNEPYVALEFKAKGGKIFADYTGQHVGDRFAIVLDKKVRSAPVIREKIGGGRASIEMGSGDNLIARQEASVLSLVLRTGALPAPVKIDQVRTVGATLGADAIQAGRTATFVGFGLVLVFMLLYYKKAGAVSVVALVCNLMLVMALLATVGATLTLPGIAGIALTVGMAVDCNIIIFERIREEKALGKNARAATDAGFSKAFLAVIDANITTFIAGVVLYTYGTGPIKGFAVTLMIGIITTLFTGIFLSRTIMDWLTRKTSARLSI